MEQKVQFTIGSIFKGEGFKQAQSTIKEMDGAMKKSVGTISMLASNVGMMDAKYAKATNAITGMLQALTSGNPIIMATQVAITGLTFVTDKMMKKADELRERSERLTEQVRKMHEQVVKAWSEEQAAQMQKFLENLESIGTQFDTLTKQANDFTAAINKLDATKDNGKILQMQIDKLYAMQDKNDVDAALVEAKENYKIVLQQNANREKYAQEKIDAANQSRIDAQSKISNANMQIAEIDAKYIENLDKINDIGEQDATIRKQLVQDNSELMKKRKALEKNISDSEQKIVMSQHALAQAEQEMENAILQGKLDRLNANKRIVDAQDKVAQAEIDAANAKKEQIEKERKQQQDELAKAKQKLNEAEQTANNAAQNLKNAQDAFNANINENLVNDSINKFFAGGGMNQIANRLNLQGKGNQDIAADVAIKAGIENGSIRTLDQANRAGRNAARAYRDYASSKQARQEAQDERRRQALQKEADRAAKTNRNFDKRKQDELDRLNQLKDAKGKARENLEKAQQAEKDAALNIQTIKDSVANIEKKLGLK